MNIVTKQKMTEHPLESALGIEPGTTLVEYTEVLPAEVVEMPNYDDKDNEIEGKLEEIYTAAMGQVEIIGDVMERVEGKYKARIGEVTATMLNVALGAVREKSVLKMHKDKLPGASASGHPAAQGSTHQTNNTLVFASHDEMLRIVADKLKGNQA